MQTKKKSLSVVMPALNEEEGIISTIESIPRKELAGQGYHVEVVIIDGGSTDRTVELAKKAGARVINSERGYGRQYKNGLKQVKGEIVITGDSDGTYPFEEIPKYLKLFENEGLDFATVNRFAGMEKGAMHFMNHIGNMGLTLATNLLFNLRMKDSQSGMWIIKKSKLDKLVVLSDGMPFSQEIKIEAFKKLKSGEIPGKYKARIGETKLLKLKDGWGNLSQLIRKRFFQDNQV